EVDIFEINRYIYNFVIYAIEDGLYDFKEDVIGNQGWTEEQADRRYEMLQRLMASLKSQADVLSKDL
ncbi:MAG: hypothetical protein ACRDHW_08110, partial [Ktedonobacteraceae bacterium]